jgi:hypothetical protein
MKRLAGFISAAGMVFTVACGQTDAGITTAVKSKLASDDAVKAYQVDVDTNNHVVTLKGDVNTSVAKERAVDIAKNTNGVRDVIDQLNVIDTAATSGRLDNDKVTVTVDDDVKSDAEKAGAATKDAGAATKDAAKHGAKATKNAAEKAADKTVDATKKVGSTVKDVFTDDNKDSDHDGH